MAKITVMFGSNVEAEYTLEKQTFDGLRHRGR